LVAPLFSVTPQTANTIGLVLGIIGVVLIFIWGPPQPNLEPGVALGIEEATPLDRTDNTVADQNRAVEARRCRHIIFSRLGLALIGIAFGFQLTATWLPARRSRPTNSREETPP
jgi:hypothetical protein